MALQLSHADEYGDVYEQSYWRVVQVNLCKADATGNVTFYGYASEAAKGKRVIGSWSRAVTPEQFAEYFGPDELNPEGRNPWEAAYRFAKADEFFGGAADA
jgi:hypothetical protein